MAMLTRRITYPVLAAALVPCSFGLRADPPSYADKGHLLVYADDAGKVHPVKTPADWERRRAHILAGMEAVMGPLPGASRKVPPDLKVEEETDAGGHVRRKVTFAAEEGDRVTAYLLVPKGQKGKAAAMLCLHQTIGAGKDEPAGLTGSKNLHYARELADRGYVCLVPDYPGFGGYNPDPYAAGYASATMKGIWNHMRAVDVLQSLPEVDGGRVGVIGHSLGGHNALFAAAFDARLKVVVTSCGFTSFPKYQGGKLNVWANRRAYMPRIASAYGSDPKRVPFDFPEVLAAIAPRAVFVNAPTGDGNFDVGGVRECVAAAGPVYELLGGKGKLAAVHPRCGHDFPPDVREKAYQAIDRALAGK